MQPSICPLSLLYNDGPVLAVNKPGGLLTQAPPGIDSLEYRVKMYMRETEGRGENGYLGIPHRLDRPVSGVIVFGKNSRATHRLSEQFERREIDKTYWAVVQGTVEQDTGTWIDFVRKVPDEPRAEITAPINPDAREAVLHYLVLLRFVQQDRPFTRLEIKLETGRMHQIRLQCSTHGHPVAGDAKYGSDFPFGNFFDDERRREIALHSRSIVFRHPLTKEPVRLTAPLPELWNGFPVAK
ncbi:MAG: RluA family pseudouridine synthase [Planctomycetaceae bacterium]|jgi:RluA family pseudouridine synthase|nr:RluA family pseudouridine synthase [Planctomycetaceae bacterium]